VYPVSGTISLSCPTFVHYYKLHSSSEKEQFAVYATIRDTASAKIYITCPVTLQVINSRGTPVMELQESVSEVTGIASFENILLPGVGIYTLRATGANVVEANSDIVVLLDDLGEETPVYGQVGSGEVELFVPVYCIEQEAAIIINEYAGVEQATKNKIESANNKIKSSKAVYYNSVLNMGSLCEFSAVDKFHNSISTITFAGGGAMLSLPYLDENGDGIVDGIGIDAKELRIFRLDEDNEKWVMSEGYQSVNKERKRVELWVNHLSVYCLMGGVSEGELSIEDLMSYPNPFSGVCSIMFKMGSDADVTIGIYTISGRLIRKLLDGEALGYGYQAVEWNGLDGDGREIANGIYLYKVIARSNGEKVEKSGKIVRIK
jgi:hypothetical protein